ncbi:general secretion pathway protein GspB [uncultured Gilvimarinus sp.]|uniref:general secretion pathway protein GspB n=1 Tax=uncultured Gilvimarinus sp. TaxID=1689143 RepID=UPI0030ECB17B
MSLILDALRKADRERQQQHNGVPGIDATHTSNQDAPRKLWPWLVALVVLVSLLLALVIWLLLERKPSVAPTAPSVQAPAAVPQAPQPATGTVQSAAQPHSQMQQSPAEPPPAQAAGAGSDTVAQPAPAATSGVASSSASSEAVLDDEVARLYNTPPPDETPVTVAPRPEVTAVSAGSVAPEPAPVAEELRSSLLAAHPNVGTIRDLPLAVQNEIPTLMYSAHEYRAGGVSEVMINSQSLREGQTLQGLTLEVIAEDGVIMRSGDHFFKLTAMSSWVNM